MYKNQLKLKPKKKNKLKTGIKIIIKNLYFFEFFNKIKKIENIKKNIIGNIAYDDLRTTNDENNNEIVNMFLKLKWSIFSFSLNKNEDKIKDDIINKIAE